MKSCLTRRRLSASKKPLCKLNTKLNCYMLTAEGGTLPLLYPVGFVFPFLNLLSFTQFGTLAKHLITQNQDKEDETFNVVVWNSST